LDGQSFDAHVNPNEDTWQVLFPWESIHGNRGRRAEKRLRLHWQAGLQSTRTTPESTHAWNGHFHTSNRRPGDPKGGRFGDP